MSTAGDDEPVPRLPRGRGIKLSGPQLMRIAITLMLLIALLVMHRQCADSVSKFVTGFGDQGSGSATPSPVLRPGEVDQPSTAPAVGSAGDYELLTPNMTEAEQRAAIDRARAKAAAQSPAGSASSAAGSASTGSNAPPSPRP
ncbi:MAG: hypothetical protein AB7O24_09800 [Kofleriaceae bacterium]